MSSLVLLSFFFCCLSAFVSLSLSCPLLSSSLALSVFQLCHARLPCVLLSSHINLCFLFCISVCVSCTSCFILIVTCSLHIMFSFASSVSSIRLHPAMFPRCFLFALIPLFLLSAFPSAPCCDLSQCCIFHLVPSQFFVSKPSNKDASKFSSA